MRPIFAVLSTALAILVSVVVPAHAQESDMISVTGQIGYRERIALLPGSMATITLSDISRQDVAAPVIAETAFPIRGVPTPFELGAAQDKLQPGHRYALRATIRDKSGTLRWTTDSTLLVDPGQTHTDLGMVTLVQVSAEQPALAGGAWLVEDINGQGVMDILQTTLAFDDAGQVSGNAGCNRYSGTYTLNDGTLQLGPLALTRKACPPAITNQEQKFLATVAGPLAVAFDATGALILTGADGMSLRARRN